MLKAAVCQSELNLHSLAASPPTLRLLTLPASRLGFSIFYSGFLRCLPMATSDGLDGCLQRGRSQSDPNILTEPGIDLAHGTGKTDASLSAYIYEYGAMFYYDYHHHCRCHGDVAVSKRHPRLPGGISEHQEAISVHAPDQAVDVG